MALITCPECNNSVSTKAKTCPHCGAPVKIKKKTSLVTWIFAALLVLGFVALVNSPSDRPASVTIPAASPTTDPDVVDKTTPSESSPPYSKKDYEREQLTEQSETESQVKAEEEARQKEVTEQRDAILANLRTLSESGSYQAIIDQGAVYADLDQDVAGLVDNARQVLTEQAEAQRLAHEEKAREERKLAALQRKWHVSKSRSALDDSLNVYMHVTADSTILGTLNRPVRPELWILCRENTTSVYADWKVFISIQDSPMTYRIDSQQARTKTFNITTDHNALGYFSGGRSIPFVKALFRAKELLVQVTPYGKSPAQVTFDVSGIEEVIKPLRKACHW